MKVNREKMYVVKFTDSSYSDMLLICGKDMEVENGNCRMSKGIFIKDCCSSPMDAEWRWLPYVNEPLMVDGQLTRELYRSYHKIIEHDGTKVYATRDEAYLVKCRNMQEKINARINEIRDRAINEKQSWRRMFRYFGSCPLYDEYLHLKYNQKVYAKEIKELISKTETSK